MRDIATVRTYTTSDENYLRLKIVRCNSASEATFALGINTQMIEGSVSRALVLEMFNVFAEVRTDWPTV